MKPTSNHNLRLFPAILGGGLLLALLIYLAPFLIEYRAQLLTLTYQHLRMLLLALPPAIGIGVGMGIVIHRRPALAPAVIGFAAVLLTIPSLALFGGMIPLLAPFGAGVGLTPAVIALVLYSQLPIIRNTYTGLNQISPEVIKAARGMGFSPVQIIAKIQLPLAAPILLAGIRTAVVFSVGVAAVAAYIGGGGLGRWIFGGIRRSYPEMMLAGAVMISLLAVLLDRLLALLQNQFVNYPGGDSS